MGHALTTMASLHDGIPVPEFDVRIPWLISERELFEFIPRAAFNVTYPGWPQLRFTLLGVNGEFAFNFVTHYRRKLLEVRMRNDDEATFHDTFCESAECLRRRLGDPNSIDMPNSYHLRWDDGRVSVDNHVDTPDHPVLPGLGLISHTLSVFARFGLTLGRVEAASGANARVRDLLASLPGVRVMWVQPSSDFVRFGLSVSDQRLLARLVHLGCAINMPLVAEVDWSCQSLYSHEDPECIRYDLRVPVSPEDGPNDGLGLVEQLLTEWVQQRAPE